MAETLFKFLRPGGVGLFSGYAWPQPDGGTPGAWVEVEGPIQPCRRGVHVCRTGDLPYWLAPRLFEVEVGGERVPHAHKLVVSRARLLREVDGWPDPVAQALADDCARRTRDLAVRELGLLHRPEAGHLSSAPDLRAVESAARAALGTGDDNRPAKAAAFLRYAADAAEYATTAGGTDAARYAAYVAAYAADRATPEPGVRLPPGVTGFAVERRRQAEVLAAALGR